MLAVAAGWPPLTARWQVLAARRSRGQGGRAMRRGLTRALGTAAVVLLAGLAMLQLAAAATALPASAARPAQRGEPGRRGGRPLQPWPVTITIRTVPALPGIRFRSTAWRWSPAAGGTASMTERHNFASTPWRCYHTQIHASGRQYRFARWAGQRDPNQAFRRPCTACRCGPTTR